MDQSIYTRHGGYQTIYTIIYELYQELCDHPEIAQHFIGVNIDRLIKLQTQFISKSLGANIDYNGRALYRAHHHMHITSFQYEQVSHTFIKLFKKHGFHGPDLEAVIELLKAEQGKIITSNNSLIDSLVKPFYFVIDYFEDILRKRGSLIE